MISILHPTARVRPYPSFPQGWRGACDQFFATCANPVQVEYVLAVHESRWEEFWRANLQTKSGRESAEVVEFRRDMNEQDVTIRALLFPSWGSIRIVRNADRDCVVDQINAAAKAATGQLLVGIMDDLTAPEFWDARLLAVTPDLNGEYVIDLTGEVAPWIVYGAMTRKRYDRFGYVLHPSFESMYADNYFSRCARRDGVVVNGRGLGFKHLHPGYGLAVRDEIYDLQNRPQAYAQGHATFEALVTSGN